MDKVWLFTLISILLVSLMSLAGIAALLLQKTLFKKAQSILVSFAVGTLIGGAVLHLLPESLEHDHSRVSAVMVVVSILVFFVMEKYLNFHAHKHTSGNSIKSFGPLNLFADGLHNFLDGILIAAAYSVDIHTGVVATVVVLAHELPQEIGDFAILVQAGYKPKKALFFNLLSALTSFLGGILVLAIPGMDNQLSKYILPLAAGGFLYIALADLMPELNKQNSPKKTVFQILAVLTGLMLMWFLLDSHTLHH